MKRSAVVAAIVGTLLTASAVLAQEGRSQEVAVQGTGFFTKNSDGDGVHQHTTDTGGFLVSYRYHFNTWLAVDASYGYGRNTHQNFTSAGQMNVRSDMHEFTGALVVTIPHSFYHMNPYVLAGSGALYFRPTSNSGTYFSVVDAQARPVFLYGGGANYNVTKRLMLRLEYRGFVYQAPDFDSIAMHTGVATHMAQPSAGIVYSF